MVSGCFWGPHLFLCQVSTAGPALFFRAATAGTATAASAARAVALSSRGGGGGLGSGSKSCGKPGGMVKKRGVSLF